MSGMNSGLDTESIINALTANTKLKATKQERNVLKYEATQEAYRDIISKMQSIKNKYFDILNKDSYLSGASIWNKYSSKVYDSGNLETLASGISVSTSINTNPGDYKITVNKTAKQAKLTGKSISGNAKIDTSTLESGKEYGMTVTVGDTTKTIKFTAGDDAETTNNSINDALEEAFGESNDSVGTAGNRGMVYLDDDGQLTSRNGKGITMSGVGEMKAQNDIDLSNVKSGNNTVTFQIGDKTVSASFQTIESKHFDEALGFVSSDGERLIDPTTGKMNTSVMGSGTDGEFYEYAKSIAEAELREELGTDGGEPTGRAIFDRTMQVQDRMLSAAALFEQISDDYKESVRYESFKNWKSAAEADGTWDTKVDTLYNKALEKQKDDQISKWVVADEDMNNAYKAYKDTFAANTLSSEAQSKYTEYRMTFPLEDRDSAKSLYDWAQDNEEYKKALDEASPAMKSAYDYIKNENGTFGDKITKLEHKYEGVGNGESDYQESYYTEGYKQYKDKYVEDNLSTGAKNMYNKYLRHCEDAGETAKSISEWAEDDSLSDSSLEYGNSLAKKDLEDAKISYNLSTEAKIAYATYKANLSPLDEPLRVSEWVADTTSGFDNAKAREDTATLEDPITSYDKWYADKVESDSWKLNKSSWTASESNLFSQYKKSVYTENNSNYDLSKENIIDHFNESALKNSIGNLSVTDENGNEVKLEVTYNKGDNTSADGSAVGNSVTIKAYTETTDSDGNSVKNYQSTSMTIGKSSANDAAALGNAGADESTAISQITNSTKLSDIGAEADANGNYTFDINGISFSFSGDTTVNDMMKKVNASSAGVKMTYSSLDNAFTVTASKYGVAGQITVGDTNGGSLLSTLGIAGGDFTAGENLEVEINGQVYQSDTNSIDADGSTFTFGNNAKIGEEFNVSIGKDTSAIKDLIKDFVKDYNQLIEDVYKYLDEKPEKDYYFLTDTDKEDLDLTEKQEEKWEEKSKKGLLYHDSITSTVMTSLRTALMGSVEGLDGNIFSLSSLGIKTASDYNQHGKLVLSEDDLDKAIANNFDDIQKLFSDSENGIMKKFSAALDAGIGTTGENKGTLIRKAGLASGSTALNNEIYNAIKRTKTRITSLNSRYENEQNRLWKRYSNMESMLGTLNSQQTSFSSYFMQ